MATLKQQKAVAAIVENSRSKDGKSLGEVLKDAGYSESVAVTPTQVTRAKGFRELLEKYLPDEKLQKKHQQLLEASKLSKVEYDASEITEDEVKKQWKSIGLKFLVKKITRTINQEKGTTKDYYVVHYHEPDNLTQREALKEAYKLKGYYEPEQHTITFKDATDEELKQRAAAALENILGNRRGAEETEVGKLIEDLRT